MAERYLYIDINPALVKRALGMPGQIEILGSVESLSSAFGKRGPGWIRLLTRSPDFPETREWESIPAVELQITDERTLVLATGVTLPNG